MTRKYILFLCLFVLAIVPSAAQTDVEDPPPVQIVNDEGGPVAITGLVTYTNTFFTSGTAQPLIILEDQTGFITRNRGFEFPEESQTLAQITSDFFESPFSYSLALPIVPRGISNDVDNDDKEEPGVQVFAIAYWDNTWGSPFLEPRDQGGGGWSTAYASTRTSSSPLAGEAGYEYIGGTLLVFAPDDEQGFPSGFGDDGYLFTEDDPIVTLPQGYTLVNMDTDPFTFDRSAEPVVDLIEGEGSEADDFSMMNYTEAFDAMIEKMSTEYSFTEFKGIDWDALYAEFQPIIAQAEEDNDARAFSLGLRDLLWRIPDGHVAIGNSFVRSAPAQFIADGVGMAVFELSDGSIIVNYLQDRGPADLAGIELGATILEINGQDIQDAIADTIPWNAPYSNPINERLDQVRYVTRFPPGSAVEVTYRNPESDDAVTTTLNSIPENGSLIFSAEFVFGEPDATRLPVEFDILDSGYGYVSIANFIDNSVLTIQLWERMVQTLQDSNVPGLIIDMRDNTGGFGFLADQMAAYFFNEPLVLGNSARYDPEEGEFVFDPNLRDEFILPPEEFRYNGDIVVLIGPGCFSACEFFTFDMTLQNRATVIGHYPTGGLGGGVQQFFMPENTIVQFTVGRAVGPDGNIHIEGGGVAPDVVVPVTLESALGADTVLETAVDFLSGASEAAAQETLDNAIPIAIGDTVSGAFSAGERVAYLLEIPDDTVLDFIVTGGEGELDTVLRLYVAGETEPAISNDDDEEGDTVNSALRGIQVPGGLTVIVEVGGFGDNIPGEFELSITESE